MSVRIRTAEPKESRELLCPAATRSVSCLCEKRQQMKLERARQQGKQYFNACSCPAMMIQITPDSIVGSVQFNHARRKTEGAGRHFLCLVQRPEVVHGVFDCHGKRVTVRHYPVRMTSLLSHFQRFNVERQSGDIFLDSS